MRKRFLFSRISKGTANFWKSEGTRLFRWNYISSSSLNLSTAYKAPAIELLLHICLSCFGHFTDCYNCNYINPWTLNSARATHTIDEKWRQNESGFQRVRFCKISHLSNSHQKVNINGKLMHHYTRVAGGEPIGNYWLRKSWGTEFRQLVRLLRSGLQIRRYTPVYQYPNDGVRAGGDTGGNRGSFC